MVFDGKKGNGYQPIVDPKKGNPKPPTEADKYYQLWLSVVDENTKNADEVKRLRQRVVELEAEIEAVKKDADRALTAMIEMTNERDVAVAENTELHRTIMKIHNEYRSDVLDGERYRWVRDDAPFDLLEGGISDEEIDAAMNTKNLRQPHPTD